MSETESAQPEKPRKIAWWRIGVGMLFILMVARSHFAPASKPLVASNPGEQLGMNAAPVTFFLIGAYLLLTGIHSAWPKNEE
jgi:hypothetical protein